MPAFRDSSFGKEKRLWSVPRRQVHNKVPIGKILDTHRTQSSVPEIYREEMETLGYNHGKGIHESRWERVYMPAFRDSPFGKEKRLWSAPHKHVHQKVPIGKILASIRTENSFIPPMYVTEMETLGHHQGKSTYESRWDHVYMPAIRDSSFGKEKRLWSMPWNHVHDTGARIGQVLSSTSIPPSEHIVELKAMGYTCRPTELPSRKRKQREDTDDTHPKKMETQSWSSQMKIKSLALWKHMF
jgi:hypothetical protein